MTQNPLDLRVALLAALTLPALTGHTTAQQPDRPGIDHAILDATQARDSAAFQQFLQQSGGTWWTRWCPATGTPTEIFGTGLPIAGWVGGSVDAARDPARATLLGNAELLGLGDDEFREAIAAEFGNVYSFTYAQFHHGLPVIGGRADVRINKCGRVAFLGSTALQVGAAQPIVPALTELDAQRTAWLALGKDRKLPVPGPDRATRLVLWGDLTASALTPVFLCWEVPVDAVDADGNGPIGRYYVDALDGTVRHYTDDKCSCGHVHCAHRHGNGGGTGGETAPPLPPATYTVMAYARDGASALTTPTNIPMPGIEVNVPGIGILVTDAQGQFTANLTSPTSVTVDCNGTHYLLITGPSAPTVTQTLQPGTAATLQLLGSGATDAQVAHTTCALWTHRVNEWARSILGNSTELNTADGVQPRVNITATCNAYYSNNTINFYAAGGSCTNSAAASVVAHEWGHGLDDRYGGISQTQGLSEGWGDICSEYLLDNPIIGDGFFTTGAGIRDGNNTTQYPPPSEVHAAGEVWMGFAWRFRDNLRAAFGTPAAIALSESLVVGTIAANATDQPGAVLQVFLADDDNGNLTDGVPHYAQLEPACLAHNLPYPVRQLGSVAAATLADTDQQMLPRFVVATAIPNLGTLNQVNLVYNDGAPHTVAMLATGNPDEYRALLPGKPAPATISWHVEALHSTGAVLRSPAGGENQYQVIALSRFWFDDFDHGATGWTHGTTMGADDWEIGTPIGASGPGWSDPPAAASGTTCAGMDLTGDGAYSPSSWGWLRSPAIDCTGKFGLRLRFKRWLTVDSIARDIALLKVNINGYWVNNTPGATPILDNAWNEQTIAIPLADNNPSVVLEWSLRSDATGAFGGWTIDDVELLTTSQPVPLPNTMQILPPMAAQGTPMTLTIHTQQPSNPFYAIAGDAPGPTQLPGLPLLQLGGNAIYFGAFTNAAGDYTLSFNAPYGVAATGTVWYSQVLTVDANQQLVTSNQMLNLFRQ